LALAACAVLRVRVIALVANASAPLALQKLLQSAITTSVLMSVLKMVAERKTSSAQ